MSFLPAPTLPLLQAALTFSVAYATGLGAPMAAGLAIVSLHPLLATLSLILILQRVVNDPFIVGFGELWAGIMALGAVQVLRVWPDAHAMPRPA